MLNLTTTRNSSSLPPKTPINVVLSRDCIPAAPALYASSKGSSVAAISRWPIIGVSKVFSREKGSTVMRLDTYEGNAPALAMYPKLGYRTVGKTMFHFQNLIWENLTCFEKRL